MKNVNISCETRRIATLLFFCAPLFLFASTREVVDSARLGAELEDSVSAMSIKPIRRPERLLKRIVRRLQYDMGQMHERGCYQVDAHFSQGTLQPFSASSLVSAEGGVGLDNVLMESFSFEGPYELATADSSQIQSMLLQFATLSPVHAHKAHWESQGAMSPLVDAKATMRCFDVKADSIADESGRSVVRFRFAWKRKQRKDFDWDRHDGEITGTAYFDGRSLRLRQFYGEAHLPSLRYDTRLCYQIDYVLKSRSPEVRQITVDGTKGDMVMKASVRRVNR